MTDRSRPRSVRTALAGGSALALLMVSAVPASADGGSGGSGAPLSVMTRNMYLGTDLAPLINAKTPTEFVEAAAEGYLEVEASKVSERAAGLAREIKITRPDVVSLQEVYLWRTGTLGDPAPAMTQTINALDSLKTALKDESLDYAVAVAQDNADIEVPVPDPRIKAPDGADGADVRLTDRDVILVRADLRWDNAQMRRYSGYDCDPTDPCILEIKSDVLGTVPIERGWVSVDVTRSGLTSRVINTHLEAYVPVPGVPQDWNPTYTVQRAQAEKLLTDEVIPGDGQTPTRVILSGDFNSGPSKPDAIDDPPIETFNDILEAGFVDTWSDTRRFLPGYTWPINDGGSRTATVPDQRIDHVFVRGAVRPLLDVRTGVLKTRSGLFVSDHLGLVAYTWLQN